MSELTDYVIRRSRRDPEFAEGLESGYATFKLGALLRQARERSGLTQEQVAERLATKKSAISRIERRAGDIRLSTLEAYASAIGWDLSLVLRPGEHGGRASSAHGATRRAPLMVRNRSMLRTESSRSELPTDQLHWANKRRRQGLSQRRQRELLIAQKGRCKLSGARMVFDLEERTPRRGGSGCHPLSPAVDHVAPGRDGGGRQLICYALNDLKGHLPQNCFEALQKTRPWIRLMKAWRAQAENDPSDREAFRQLLRPSAR